MSLNTKKTINSIALEGSSVINGVEVLTLSTQVSSTSSYSNVQQIIKDQQGYDDNKAAVRKDVLAFQDAIFDAQDQLGTKVDSGVDASASQTDSNAATSSSAASSSASSVAE